jgi:hypothetical protein
MVGHGCRRVHSWGETDRSEPADRRADACFTVGP